MNRKRWTPKEVVTEADLHSREKKRWQLALRRYIIEQKPSSEYAPYFGLDAAGMRKWIEIQFTDELNWENFAKAWQLEHVVPVAYFDFSVEEDLLLYWNFINIRVEKTDADKVRGGTIDIIAVKPYFEQLYNKTGYALCSRMLNKLTTVESASLLAQPAIERFLTENKVHLEQVASLSKEEFALFNAGTSVKDILLEREILRKFGDG